MEKVIEIDIVSEFDLFEKYNKRIVSSDLINYLIKNIPYFTKKDNIKIIINNYCNNIDCILLIKDGLNREYNDCSLKYNENNFAQFLCLIFGILFLFFSTLIEGTIFKEIVLIGGWVLIWEFVESEIFSDFEIKRKQRRLKKLLESEFIENKVSS